MSHLKTFTVLVTVPARVVATSLEAAIISGVTGTFGINADGMRADAFEGSHTCNALTAEAARAHAAMHAKPRTWADLTRDEQAGTLRAAEEVGGGFVSHLATAWRRADSSNSAKLGEAFGAMLAEHYGPGTPAYGSVN
jgi:hypothetical protein